MYIESARDSVIMSKFGGAATPRRVLPLSSSALPSFAPHFPRPPLLRSSSGVLMSLVLFFMLPLRLPLLVLAIIISLLYW